MSLIEDIYQTYPRKVGKRDAFRAIEKALRRLVKGECGELLDKQQAAELLIAKTSKFAESDAGRNGSYTPYPATWFNRSSYLDDESEWNDKREIHKKIPEHIARTARNREAILAGLGIGPNAGSSGTDHPTGSATRGNPLLVGDVPE